MPSVALFRFASVACLSTAAAAAHAAPTAADCERSGSWVELTAPGSSEQDAGALQRELATSLEGSGVRACSAVPGATGSAPLADIRLESTSSAHVRVTIVVRDAVTHKLVSRELDLTAMPADGRPLAIAVAADELLRASWAELTLTTQAAKKVEPPAAVQRAVSQVTAAPAETRQGALGAQLAAERYSSGLLLMGADARAGWHTGPVKWLIFPGMRTSRPVAAPDGTVTATSYSLGLYSGLRLLRKAPELLAFGGIAIGRIEYRAEPDVNARATRIAGQTVVARAGLALRLSLVRSLSLQLSAGIGKPLLALAVNDGSHRVTGTTGIELSGSLGLEAAL